MGRPGVGISPILASKSTESFNKSEWSKVCAEFEHWLTVHDYARTTREAYIGYMRRCAGDSFGWLKTLRGSTWGAARKALACFYRSIGRIDVAATLEALKGPIVRPVRPPVVPDRASWAELGLKLLRLEQPERAGLGLVLCFSALRVSEFLGATREQCRAAVGSGGSIVAKMTGGRATRRWYAGGLAALGLRIALRIQSWNRVDDTGTLDTWRQRIEPWRPHALRHAVARTLGEAGIPDRTIAGVLGHSTSGLGTTARYTGPATPEAIRQAQDRLMSIVYPGARDLADLVRLAYPGKLLVSRG